MQFLVFLSDNPTLRLFQFVLLAVAALAVFFVFFTTRDILLRTRSALLQFFCIILVAVLPIVGFLVYLLIRPARTVKQREMEAMVRELLERGEGEGEDRKKSGKKAKHGKKQSASATDAASDASPASTHADSVAL